MFGFIRRLLPRSLKRRIRAWLLAAIGPQPQMHDMVARNDALMTLLDQKIIRTDEALRKLETRVAAMEARAKRGDDGET